MDVNPITHTDKLIKRTVFERYTKGLSMHVNIIIPFHKAYDTIENLLRSIEDQDYKDYDVAIVVDGKDKKAEYIFRSYLEPEKELAIAGKPSWLSYNKKVNVIVNKKNKGASYARNKGAELTKGDILFFIDADCELYPGMLRECVTQFELNPDIDFVYGNYRFEHKSEFYSQPFDAYHLETMNYISTMSPVRRSAFDKAGGFKVDQEFFQDWSLFYRISEAGCKGKYINEFIFSTKLPDENSISGKKGLNLAQKASKFREYHKIPDKKIAVTTFSAPTQAIQRAKMLYADYVGQVPGSRRELYPINLCFDNWQGVYLVGVFNEPLEALSTHLEYTSLNRDIKKIFHFIGTDVYQLITEQNFLTLKAIKKMFEIQDIKLFANSPRMVRELAEVGIDAELLYTPVYQIEKYQPLSPLPKDFTVAIYYSDSNPMQALCNNGKSNMPLLMDVAKALPHIKFKLFGGAAKTVKDNVEYCGRISEDKMPEFINSCSMNLRSNIHDGFPQLPIQFMCCGRQALVSVPDTEFAFAEKLSFEAVNCPISKVSVGYEQAKEEIISKIVEMQAKQDNAVLIADQVRKYYSGLMNEAVFKQRIHQCLE